MEQQPITENGLIIVRQLPVIEEELARVKTAIQAEVETALAMPCTEDSKAEVKRVRAKLRADLGMWEERRKAVKNAVLAPFNKFEAVYKDCVSDVYNEADTALKSKIDTVENEIKEQTRQEVEAYFTELCASYSAEADLSFLTFAHVGLKVGLSDTKKALMQAVRSFVERVVSDLKTIETQENATEILVEYRNTLNLNSAILVVSNRKRAVQAAEEARQQTAARAQENAQKQFEVEQVIAEAQAAENAPTVAPDPDAPILNTAFRVYGTAVQLKALRTFLTEGGYRYEQYSE